MNRILCTLISLLFAVTTAAQSTPLKTGSIAPEITLPRMDGSMFALSSLKGRLVLIDFWATWCAPCVKEQPQLKALYEKFAPEVKEGKFEIIGVSLDKDKSTWKKTVDRLKINWVQVSDLKFWRSPVAKDYGIEELPFNVLVDEQNKIIAINLHEKELENLIQRRLGATREQPRSIKAATLNNSKHE
ncbi:TlpA family protein disulfide reductase [Niabella drilacis]|uniref:Peroxiredoxin n=1 Tax=Niabella drilacis (strain DSM 25811 / CCM 8410 / CCUG 62505 / LMG 26954 / E90) TaxID=1285928 RepID=A0A1G6TA79_NIADE|nr:TlpA disulfide reductase family protein [Niabella drilacis]SDD25961.1 Peroxiredoxin [Niabella drilacis]